VEKVIQEIGPKNVVQVITDNAQAYRVADLDIEGKFPHILDPMCCPHFESCIEVYLSCKEYGGQFGTYEECHWITEVTEDANFVRIPLSIIL